MKFCDRETEMQLLEETRQRSELSSKMTVITGRRRIGKTTLIAEVKRNKNKISIEFLKQRSVEIIAKLPGYKFDYLGFSMEDM